jgi:hypothetical protein
MNMYTNMYIHMNLNRYINMYVYGSILMYIFCVMIVFMLMYINTNKYTTSYMNMFMDIKC